MENVTADAKEKTVDKKEKFPSGELLFSVIQKEYDYEQARKTAMETKAGILIPFVVAVLAFVVSYIKISNFTKHKEYSLLEAFIYISYVFLIIVTVLSVIVALIYLMKVFITYEYKRLSISEFNMDYAKNPKDAVVIALATRYKEIIEHNQGVNNNKTNYYQIGVYATLISTISTILVYGISLNI